MLKDINLYGYKAYAQRRSHNLLQSAAVSPHCHSMCGINTDKIHKINPLIM